MKLQKKIVTNKNLSKLNSLQISVKAKYYLECKTDSDLEFAFHFIKKNKVKFLVLGEGTNVVFTKPFEGPFKRFCKDNISPLPQYEEFNFVFLYEVKSKF